VKTAASTWTRTDVNFWLDCLLAVVFLVLLAISLVIRFVFPRAQESTGWTLWGLIYDEWIQAQFLVLAVLTLLILVHVMLHWNWVCNVARQRYGRAANQPAAAKKPDTGWQTIVGVGLMILLLNILGILFGVALLTIRHG
jgi:hypothetical protein